MVYLEIVNTGTHMPNYGATKAVPTQEAPLANIQMVLE
jgi:hypothetical protein